jgi:predicted RNA-binding Zn-ribbon protein involved in translation (DUF1610 family)
MKKNTIKCPCCGKDSTVTANIEEWLSDLSKAPVVFDNDGGWQEDHDNKEYLPSSDVESGGTTYTCDNCGKEIDEDELGKAAESRLKQPKTKKSKVKTK